jgi:N-acetylglucosamine kinase-like BadF-type ATPase
MQLLAESGGSKTAWYWFDENGLISSHMSAGMNPNAESSEAIFAHQKASWPKELQIPAGTEIYFYGAGLGASATENTMRDLLGQLFPETVLHLHSDMLAAARATAGNEAAIVCILGTGSNCCYFDGEKITAMLGSHGYLFNDEGSGMDLGRALIGAALNGELPHYLEHKLRDWAGKSFLDIRTEIYQAPKTNVALAEYSRFLAENLEDPVVRTLIQSRMMTFFQKTILRITGFRDLPIHFAGSIASVYSTVVADSLKLLNLSAGKFVAAPGEALLAYHIQQLKEKAI